LVAAFGDEALKTGLTSSRPVGIRVSDE